MSDQSDTPLTDLYSFTIGGRGPFVYADRVRELERELSAAQKDAERYRWLRDTANKADIQTALLSGLQPRFIDDAIDAAIAAEQQPPHA